MDMTQGGTATFAVCMDFKRGLLGMISFYLFAILMAGYAMGAAVAPNADEVTERIKQCGGNKWSGIEKKGKFFFPLNC